MPRISLSSVLDTLRSAYGRLSPPPFSDPWHYILWENVAYLAPDERRTQAFATLRERVGLSPQEILSASDDELLAAASAGILAGSRVDRMRSCAETVVDEFGGDLAQILDWPVVKARKALQKFPGIGAPGAEKILLFCRRSPALALESNGLRVLLRLGFGEESSNYSASYRSVQASIQAEPPRDFPELIEAHQLLRKHGQEVCKNSKPRCEACPLTRSCQAYERWQGEARSTSAPS